MYEYVGDRRLAVAAVNQDQVQYFELRNTVRLTSSQLSKTI